MCCRWIKLQQDHSILQKTAKHYFLHIGNALAKRLDFAKVESLDPEVAAERWGVARAYYSFGSNSRVRSVRARQELGWLLRHTSVIDWILNDMPI